MLTAVTPDALVLQYRPIRRIKSVVDKALAELAPTLMIPKLSCVTVPQPQS